MRYLTILSFTRSPSVPSNEPPQLQLELREGAEATPSDALEAVVFRPIHYLGSKLRLASAIADALDSADATRGTVLDLFAGSGTTALALAGHRRVIASDIQEYSRVICSALLASRSADSDIVSTFAARLQAGSPRLDALRQAVEPLVQFERDALHAAKHGETDAICLVLEHGSILAAERGVASGSSELQSRLKEVAKRMKLAGLAGSPLATTVRYFGGAYFSYAQAVELDCLAALAYEAMPSALTDVFTAALLSTASDTVNTVGKQFAQPIRPRNKQGVVKQHLLAKIDRDRHLDVRTKYMTWLQRYALHRTRGTGHVVARADYREALTQFAGQYSVVYADPPYTRDHYSRFYHVLETMARRDNPSIARSPGSSDDELSRGLYRDDRHQSPFCIRSQAPGAFRDLFRLASQTGAQMVVSYSPFQSGAHPRLMQIDALLSLARDFYKSVELESVDGVSHSKLNHSSLNFDMPPEAEVLIVCRLRR
jgi:adenine-specific DNA-methyltransferase